MKRILLIDNTFDPPHGCPEIQACLRAAAQPLGALEIVAVRAPEGKIPRALQGFDGAVLSGSKTRISEEAPWISAEMEAIRALAQRRMPMLGICYGEQLIAKVFGGEQAAVAAEAANVEFGWVEVAQKQGSELLRGLPEKFHSFAWHSDEVRALPADFRVVAGSALCPVQAYEKTDAPIWGVQFHPERGWEKGEESLAKRAGEKKPVINASRGGELFDRKVAEVIFGNFLRLVWGAP